MSYTAVVYAIEIISTAYAVDTMVKGIEEGNMTKAVLGGVGAYLGFSSLGTIGSTAGEAAAAGGTEAGASALSAEQAAAQAATDASMTAPLEQAGGEAVAGQAGQAATQSAAAETAAVGAGSAGANAGGTGLLNTAAEKGGGQVAEKGLLSSIGDWAQNNQTLAYGAMQVGGNALAGSAKQDWEEKMIKEAREREDMLAAQSRKRRGYWAPNPVSTKSIYNPRTGQFETTGAN